MWGRAKKLISKIETLEENKEKLEDEKVELKSEVAGLKSQKKIEEEQIKHLVRIKDEKRDLEFQKREVTKDAARAEEVAKVKNEYQDKLTDQLNKQIDDNNDRYAQILKRLPDVNVRLKGDIG